MAKTKLIPRCQNGLTTKDIGLDLNKASKAARAIYEKLKREKQQLVLHQERDINGNYGYRTSTGGFRTFNNPQTKLNNAVLKTYSAKVAKFEAKDAKRRNHSDEREKKVVRRPLLTIDKKGNLNETTVKQVAPSEDSAQIDTTFEGLYLGNKVWNVGSDIVKLALAKTGSNELAHQARNKLLNNYMSTYQSTGSSLFDKIVTNKQTDNKILASQQPTSTVPTYTHFLQDLANKNSIGKEVKGKKLSLRELLGLSKGAYGSLNKFQKQALEDYEQYINSGQFRNKFLYNPTKDSFRYDKSLIEEDIPALTYLTSIPGAKITDSYIRTPNNIFAYFTGINQSRIGFLPKGQIGRAHV